MISGLRGFRVWDFRVSSCVVDSIEKAAPAW